VDHAGGIRIRIASSPELSPADRAGLRALFDACWPDGSFTQDDVDHAMGGTHWLALDGERIVAHASVVARELHADGVPLQTGYVEGVATLPGHQHRGIATRLMRAAGDHIRERCELGALSTDVHPLYEGTGWERWRGPTYVRTDAGDVRTEDEDEGIMILRTPRTPPLAGTEPLSCEWRAGDCW
jgi:aminoglycoside 2'-N-acetyltransferase I